MTAKKQQPSEVSRILINGIMSQMQTLFEENAVLRTLLLTHGLSEEQLQIQVEGATGLLRTYAETTRLLRQTCEEVLRLFPDVDVEAALREWPGTGKPQ